MNNAAIPQFSVCQAIEFCKVFQAPALFQNGKFRQSQLKILNDEERRICLEALEKISSSQLSDWKPNPKMVLYDPNILNALKDKIKQLPVDRREERLPWYQAPFIWIAKQVNSFFLWFQNTFLGRISSQNLLDQVAIFCQNASTAESDVKKIEQVILPDINKKIKEKIEERDEVILKGNLANGLLETYKVVLALKSEGKREHIMQKAIAYSAIDEIDSLTSKPFFVIVRELLSPYFKSVEGDLIAEEEFKNLGEAFKKAKANPKAKRLQSLQKNYSLVMSDLGPMLLSAKAKKVSNTLAPLYETAGKAIQLTQELDEAVKELRRAESRAEKKNDPLSIPISDKDLSTVTAEKGALSIDETKKEDPVIFSRKYVEKLQKELKDLDAQIQIDFDSIFKKIEHEIDEEGKKLYNNKYGTCKELNDDTSRLQLDKLNKYGLQALVIHQGKLMEKTELLKNKYIS